MGVAKLVDIEKRFTEVVAQYMAQGLAFDTGAMRGSSGEQGKVALTNGKHVYMIYLHDEQCKDTDLKYWWNREMVLTVRMFVKSPDRWATYWNSDGTVVYEEKWYELADRRRGKVYTTAREDLVKAEELREARLMGRNIPQWKDVKYVPETVISIVKQKTGRKRVHAENILSVQRRTDYHSWAINTMFNGKKDTIIISGNV